MRGEFTFVDFVNLDPFTWVLRLNLPQHVESAEIVCTVDA